MCRCHEKPKLFIVSTFIDANINITTALLCCFSILAKFTDLLLMKIESFDSSFGFWLRKKPFKIEEKKWIEHIEFVFILAKLGSWQSNIFGKNQW